MTIKEELKNRLELKDDNLVEELRIKAVDYKNDLQLGYENDLIQDLINEIDHAEYINDLIHELSDNYVEIYTNKIFKLYSKNLDLLEYANYANDIYGQADNITVTLRQGIYYYNECILNYIMQFIEQDHFLDN